MNAPLLNPEFKWISSATHGDSTAFRQRQQARLAAAQRPSNVQPLPKRDKK